MNHKMNHTKEPWTFTPYIFDTEYAGDIEASLGNVGEIGVIRTISVLLKYGGQEQAALDGERIVACVNACEGLSDEALKGNVVDELLKVHEKLRRIKKAAVSQLKSFYTEFPVTRNDLVKKLQDAIDQAK